MGKTVHIACHRQNGPLILMVEKNPSIMCNVFNYSFPTLFFERKIFLSNTLESVGKKTGEYNSENIKG